MNIAFYKQKDNLWLFVDQDGNAFIYPAMSCRLGIHGTQITIWIRNEQDAFIQGILVSKIQKSLTPDDFYIGVNDFLTLNALFFQSVIDLVTSSNPLPIEEQTPLTQIQIVDSDDNELDINADGSINTNLPNIDNITNALLVINNAHHEIHSGRAYTAEVVATGGSGTKATITFTTPDTARWMHIIVHARSNVEAHYILGENPTITADTGTNFIVCNRNRNSANVSGVIGTRIMEAENMTEGATVTDYGTILKEIHFGNGKVGGEVRGDDEWILKQNTTYVLEVVSEAASSDNMIEIDWYEHINN